jgi:hypothetical protein
VGQLSLSRKNPDHKISKLSLSESFHVPRDHDGTTNYDLHTRQLLTYESDDLMSISTDGAVVAIYTTGPHS